MSKLMRTLAVAALAVALPMTPASAVKRRAFVTSVAGTGNLSTWSGAGGLTGLAAGDNVCRVRAILGGLPNGDTYRAWLSDSTTDAYCHVQGLSGTRADSCGGQSQPAGPWYLANGITTFTGALTELAGPERAIYRPVTLDEMGNIPATLLDSQVWTGTQANGTRALETCNGWGSAGAAQSGRFGYALTAGGSWTDWNPASCDQPRRLLCVEPGASEAAFRPYWLPGALVFLTSASGSGNLGGWPESGAATGIAAGDAICRSLAAAAHLPAPDSFVAWLSTWSVDAADRIETDGPFRRLDGTTVGNTKADLLDGSLDSSVHVEESGAFSEHTVVWTGTHADGTHAANNCGGWTSGLDTDFGLFGLAGASRVPDWTSDLSLMCAYPARLVCISNAIVLFWDGFDATGDTSRWSSAVP